MYYPNYIFDVKQSIFYRDLKKKSHLVWRQPFCGSPAFTEREYNKHRKIAKYIGWRFGEEKYKMPMSYFDEYKHIIKNGAETQYIIPKSDWVFFNTPYY